MFLLLLIAVCALWITLGSKKEEGVTADVYQDGVLIESIDLSAVPESYTLTVTGENGCTNVVEVRPGSIGIISADCPDQICVRQGFIGSPLLPITCLPNKLVIQLRGHDAASEDGGTVIPDMIAY
nr:NusG domain II-containing protein [uncultured Acetatifactor sp.]